MTTEFKPVNVIIKHGAFLYFKPEMQVIEGQEKELLVEHMATHNQRVTITRASDYERGVRIGAFWTQNEAEEHYEQLGIPAPLLNQSNTLNPPEAAAPDEEKEIELTSLDEDELVDWLMATGRFDGESKPTVAEVVAAGQEGGPEFAETLHKAEVRASGDAPRQGVVDGLSKVTSE